ncbi:MAG: outer membrane protein-like protein [Verrucomicrobia bacterium]|nr:outer membrane protein-like protein [Verrucomicrobiota bacterium]
MIYYVSRRPVFQVLCGLLTVLGCLNVEAATNDLAGVPIKLEDFLKQVWTRNESLQIRVLESVIADERYKAERGIFEPEFVAGAEAVDRRRPNTAEQRANLGGIFGGGPNIYNERNKTYSSAIETLAPTGAKFRLGYTLQTLENNINAAANPHGEWVSTVGLAVTQPLLKNGGVTVTMAGIRAAAISSEISFQDYRKNIMEVISQAEAAYWDLYQAQEQAVLAQESLRVAQTLLTDNKKRVELGKAAEIDVLQAEAGVSERSAVLNEARQRLQTARSRAATMVSDSWSPNAIGMLAADAPKLSDKKYDVNQMSMTAYELNPSYASLMKQAELEGLRVKVAKNQRMPNLDLKGGYGFSGLARNAGDAWNASQDQDFPSWSLGVELRVPMGGGIKSRHELKAAELRREATLRALNGLGITLANTLRSSVFSVESYRDSVTSYGEVVKVHENVFTTQKERLDAGKVNSRDLLEAEEDVFRARIASLESQIRYQRSLLELDLVTGRLLKDRNLDFTQRELQNSTAVLVSSGRITQEKYQEFLKTMQTEYERRRPVITTTP